MTKAGTRDFMAPEVRTASDGRAKFSTKADIYSLGVIAQELFDFDINACVLFHLLLILFLTLFTFSVHMN